MMRHLLWKDGMTIKPLVIAICFGTLAINFLAVVLSLWLDRVDREMLVLLWVLMPNLVALGAPALLVGSEEESGTLAWLRTLPVGWRKIVDAKLLVSIVSVSIVWIVASFVFFIILATVVHRHSPPMYVELVTTTGVLHLMFFSLLLLLTGFAMAYLFRSPVTALIVLIPLIGVINALTLDVGHWINRSARMTDSTSLLLLVLLGAAALVLAWFVQRWLGRRRLVGMEGSRIARLGEPSATAQVYRPSVRVATGRPSVIAALLWQQSRQIKWTCLLLTCVTVGFVLLYYLATPNSPISSGLRAAAAFAPLVVGLGASWLGALAFYGENVRRRCAFFADRGVSPTQVWWTRLFLPACLVALMFTLSLFLAVTHAGYGNEFAPPWLMPVVLVVGFSFGQLVGQWVQRPTLSFLGAPVYGLFSCMLLIFMFSQIYPGYAATTVLIVPVLLFATWRLTNRWLAGGIDRGFHVRVVAYTALAILVPALTVFAHRCWTIPQEMTSWRAEMLAMREPGIDVQGELPKWSFRDRNSTFLYPNWGSRIDYQKNPTIDDHLELLRQELSGDSEPATHVSREDIEDFLGQSREFSDADPDKILETKLASIAVLLKWATTIREDVAAGRRSLWSVRQFASSAENRALSAINELINQFGGTKELAALVDLFPSEDLRYRSRRIGLINEWRTYQRRTWRPESNSEVWRRKAFLGQIVANRVSLLPFERVRANRYIDLATRRTLAQLEVGLPAIHSEQCRQTERLWNESRGPAWTLRGGPSGLAWDSSADQAIAQLQERFARRP